MDAWPSEPFSCFHLAGLLARASDLLQPTAAHKEAVLSACRLLHSVTSRWSPTSMPLNDGLPRNPTNFEPGWRGK